MGWAAGTELMTGVIELAQDYIPDEDDRSEFYKKFVKLMKAQDWSEMDEVLELDDVYDDMYESMFGDEDDAVDEDDDDFEYGYDETRGPPW